MCLRCDGEQKPADWPREIASSDSCKCASGSSADRPADDTATDEQHRAERPKPSGEPRSNFTNPATRGEASRRQLRLCSRRGVLMSFGMVILAGCASGGSSDVVYMDDPWNDPFYHNDWIYYYDEDDDDFLAGLDEDQKEALKEEWDALSPEDKEQIRDRWSDLSDDDRSQVREAWSSLDLEERQRVVSSMETRIRSGTLQSVTPVWAGLGESRARTGTGFERSRAGARAGSFDRGSFGGRGGGFGGRVGGGGLGGRR